MSEYSFCESVHAGPLAAWHIRKLTDQGQKFGGGIDTPSLCGRVRPPPKSNGWDLKVPIDEMTLRLPHGRGGICSDCAALYEKAVDPSDYYLELMVALEDRVGELLATQYDRLVNKKDDGDDD